MVMRPSRFGIVAIMIAILTGFALNLLATHEFSEPKWQPLTSHKEFVSASNSRYTWPEVPESVVEQIGAPITRYRGNYIYCQRYRIRWYEEYSFIGVNYYLEADYAGFPFTARSNKAVYYQHSHGFGTVWPIEQHGYADPAVT